MLFMSTCCLLPPSKGVTSGFNWLLVLWASLVVYMCFIIKSCLFIYFKKINSSLFLFSISNVFPIIYLWLNIKFLSTLCSCQLCARIIHTVWSNMKAVWSMVKVWSKLDAVQETELRSTWNLITPSAKAVHFWGLDMKWYDWLNFSLIR